MISMSLEQQVSTPTAVPHVSRHLYGARPAWHQHCCRDEDCICRTNMGMTSLTATSVPTG